MSPRPKLLALKRPALLAGVVGFALWALSLVQSPRDALQAYHTAYLAVLGIPLGALGLLFIHHTITSRWGFGVQRILEAASGTLPLMAVLFIPVLIGQRFIFPWIEDPGLTHEKSLYLNPMAFTARAVLYLAAWGLCARAMIDLSRRRDNAANGLQQTVALRRLSYAGMLGLVFLGTFACFDWVMSLDPSFNSAIFGAAFLVGAGCAGLAVTLLTAVALRHTAPLDSLLSKERLADLGSLLFGFVILWAYVSFSQYVVVWYGNLPEDAGWFLARQQGPLGAVAALVVVGHFALPFLLLLFRRIKRMPLLLAAIAAEVVLMRFLDTCWAVQPAFRPAAFPVNWPTAAALLGFVGLWAAFYLRGLAAVPLVCRNDPRWERAFAEQHEATHHA